MWPLLGLEGSVWKLGPMGSCIWDGGIFSSEELFMPFKDKKEELVRDRRAVFVLSVTTAPSHARSNGLVFNSMPRNI